MRQLALHEYWYVLLARAEKREPHPPVEMKSDQSKATPFGWSCPVGGCYAHDVTYLREDPPPICRGGFAHSFETVSTTTLTP